MWWWIVGAVVGAVAGHQVYMGPLGAVVGAVVGWALHRSRATPANARLAEIEQRIGELHSRLAAVEQRLRDGVAEPAPSRPTPVARPDAARVPPAPVIEPVAPAPVAEPASPSPFARPPAAPAPVAPIAAPRPPAGSPLGGLEDTALWRFITGGNTVARVGVVVLFFGVAFLLKYAQEHMHVPIELRLTAVAVGALVLLGIGWRLRERRRGYALAVQGGAIGILYLVIFAAFRLYGLLPPTAAFALLVAVAALSAVIAVAQDALALAVLGASGGFLAPILASTGSGNHVALFGYYAVLNAGILCVAWYKAWRVLNLVGFAFTFGIGTFWGVSFYRPEHFRTTEPFLVLFFLFYLAIPILFARRHAAGVEGYVDTVLVFGLPVVAFGLQVGLVAKIEFGAAWSALALAVVYLALASAVFGRAREGLRLLAESFLALGVVFGTLAIPLAVDGRWTSAAWALEGAAIVWIGGRQRRILAQAFGVLLQFLAGIAFLAAPVPPSAAPAILNREYLGCVMVALAGLFCAWYLERQYRRAGETSDHLVVWLMFGWGTAWWVGGGLWDIDRHVPDDFKVHVALIFLVMTCFVFSGLHTALAWTLARHAALALLPVMAAAAVLDTLTQKHPLAHLGWVAWPLALALHLLVLRRHETQTSQYQYGVHAAGVWLLAALGGWEVAWNVREMVGGQAVWHIIAWTLMPGALLLLLVLGGARFGWPLSAHRDAYLRAGAAPLAVFLWLWALVVNFASNGDPSPLPYVPVFNPLDLAQLGAVLAVALWFVEGRRLRLTGFAEVQMPIAYGVLAASAFVWANAVLLRTIHHWAGVPFDLESLVRSDLVQTALSIFWTLLALTGMVWATRHGVRAAWVCGAGLMAVVVGKLFLIDLASIGTVQRIVSFIGVGVLMLVVGYVSPVPPRTAERA